MPVEEKHIYITDKPVKNAQSVQGWTLRCGNLYSLEKFNSSTVDTNINDQGFSVRDSSVAPDSINLNGVNVTANKIIKVYQPYTLTIPKGTGPNERIGDKIFVKSVKLMFDVHFNYYNYIKYISQSSVEDNVIATEVEGGA